MGMFDTIVVGFKEGQVKLWGGIMRSLVPGDYVPAVSGRKTYSVAMREGGFVNIKGQRIIDWTSQPRHRAVFDKLGRIWDGIEYPDKEYPKQE